MKGNRRVSIKDSIQSAVYSKYGLQEEGGANGPFVPPIFGGGVLLNPDGDILLDPDGNPMEIN